VQRSNSPKKGEKEIEVVTVDGDQITGGSEPLHCQCDGVGPLIMTLEDHREELGLEHYSVSPTTLDQVFLSIVMKHDVEEEGYAKPKEKNVVKNLKALMTRR
jgi:hypothetical protein